MKVVRFLERKLVIRIFGAGFILAPFLNISLHIYFLFKESGLPWAHFQVLPVLKAATNTSLFMAICSVILGLTLLTGSVKAWKFVLGFLGLHLLLQVLNINDKAWKGPLAWPSFLINAGLFFFIFDQLVWKISPARGETPLPQAHEIKPLREAATVINLKSYRKILFSFGRDRPWGELKTLSSEMLSVKRIAEPPEHLDKLTVQINFAQDIIVDIQFDHQDGDYYFFKPLDMHKEKVTKLNKWLKKIAV